MTERLKGAQSRSREQNLEGETQPSKTFRTFGRKETKANHISSVRLGDHRADGQGEVVAAFESHYTHLFGRRERDATAQQTLLHKPAATPEGTSIYGTNSNYVDSHSRRFQFGIVPSYNCTITPA